MPTPKCSHNLETPKSEKPSLFLLLLLFIQNISPCFQHATLTCAKVEKCLQYVLEELDALHPGPTNLYIDNQAALAVVNGSCPFANHIKIQYFSYQKWHEAGDVLPSWLYLKVLLL